MITIKVNRRVCQGYGNCVLADPAVFDVDDDGLIVLLHGTVGEEQLSAVRRAVYDCPSEAISFTRSTDASDVTTA